MSNRSSSRDEATRDSQNSADAEMMRQYGSSRDKAIHAFQNVDNSERMSQRMDGSKVCLSIIKPFLKKLLHEAAL